MSKTILITGASTGLGIGLAIQGAKAGHKIFATMRNLEKRQELDAAIKNADADITVLQLDVQDMSSIETCVNQVIAQAGQLDVLINNAGIGFVRTTEQATEEDMQWVMDINTIGVMRCTKAVLPHMRQQGSGHVINISSVGGLVGQPFNEIYCASKFAVEGYTEALASYAGPAFGIHFTAVEPGGIVSEFVNNVMTHFVKTGGMIEDDYKPLLETYMGDAQKRAADPNATPVYQTPEQVADIVMDCIASDNPPIRLRTSQWGEELCELKTLSDPDGRKLQNQVHSYFMGRALTD